LTQLIRNSSNRKHTTVREHAGEPPALHRLDAGTSSSEMPLKVVGSSAAGPNAQQARQALKPIADREMDEH
jgi:hypothetical protein